MNTNYLASKSGRYPSWQELQVEKQTKQSQSQVRAMFRGLMKFIQSL